MERAEAGEVAPASAYIPNRRTVRMSMWRRYTYQRDPDSNAVVSKQAFRRQLDLCDALQTADADPNSTSRHRAQARERG